LTIVERIEQILRKQRERTRKRIEHARANPAPLVMCTPLPRSCRLRCRSAEYSLCDEMGRNPDWQQSPARHLCHVCGRLRRDGAAWIPSPFASFSMDPYIEEEVPRIRHAQLPGRQHLVRVYWQRIYGSGRDRNSPLPSVEEIHEELMRREMAHAGSVTHAHGHRSVSCLLGLHDWQLATAPDRYEPVDICMTCSRTKPARRYPVLHLAALTREIDQYDRIVADGVTFIRIDRTPLPLAGKAVKIQTSASNVQVSADRRRISFDL
jgi:hypothetical protein